MPTQGNKTAWVEMREYLRSFIYAPFWLGLFQTVWFFSGKIATLHHSSLITNGKKPRKTTQLIILLLLLSKKKKGSVTVQTDFSYYLKCYKIIYSIFNFTFPKEALFFLLISEERKCCSLAYFIRIHLLKQPKHK